MRMWRKWFNNHCVQKLICVLYLHWLKLHTQIFLLFSRVLVFFPSLNCSLFLSQTISCVEEHSLENKIIDPCQLVSTLSVLCGFRIRTACHIQTTVPWVVSGEYSHWFAEKIACVWQKILSEVQWISERSSLCFHHRSPTSIIARQKPIPILPLRNCIIWLS
jgi:hypothetical protein